MLTHARHQQIIEILAVKKSATVSELSEQLTVSSATIRTDLNQLAKYGHVIRIHGGARIGKERVRQEFSFATRQNINADKKQAIAHAAASLIQPMDSILLDASSTSVALVSAIKKRTDLHDLTVVTTGIWTTLELLGSPEINVVLAGGYVRNTSGSISGQITVEILNKFNFQKVFLGAAGISEIAGATDVHLIEVELKQTIIDRSANVILMIDSSKWGKLSLATFAELDKITMIITDDDAPREMVDQFRQQNIEIICAPLIKNSAGVMKNG
ncbi:MAG: DeoR/GlpR transcriptional regulator [Calditrichaeota bacterium]|nr:MAG: DeoR/GlpR transcriptional regulator [Calditrichota bacterium]